MRTLEPTGGLLVGRGAFGRTGRGGSATGGCYAASNKLTKALPDPQ